MNVTAKKFLYQLLNTPSPTGFELEGQRTWSAYAKKFANAVDIDSYGNTWATLNGKKNGPTVMLEAHADEIGFIIKHISKEGFVHIDRIGGSDHATARGRRIVFLGDKGPVPGIIGNTAIHIRENKTNEKVPDVHELYVDLGAANEKDVEKLGLRVGHPAVYQDAAEPFGKNRIVGRALDNRIGGFIIAEVLNKLSKLKTPSAATVYAVNAVHEEIGGLGAKMIAHRLNPDVAVVLDVTHATDSPDIDHKKHGKVTLGGGPSVTHGTANHPNVVKRLMDCAKKSKITLQHESSSRYSGTDTDQIYHVREGIPAALVSLPLRYMHSVVEMADYNDIQNVIDLLAAFVQSVKATDSFAHKL
ncbi:MAG: M42 family metallopeptidase [Verrucomicrobiota bacterium]